MSGQRVGIAFPTVLASTVHDMKNSLGMLLQALDAIIERIPEAVRDDLRELAVIKYESERVNHDLVQLLALYKIEQDQLPLNIGYHDVTEFLEEQGLLYGELLQYRHIELSVHADEGLFWYFDADLLASALGNIITNTIRYSKSAIELHAFIQDNALQLIVADDGPGYPKAMIEKQQDYLLGINQSSGSTGLGLYFSGQIARLHSKDGRQGHIVLANGQPMSGGAFRMVLP
ncbi:sensor histidine kinase [Permianibacter aggregans]|uniref:histidine kinase n=1 Tax=Permianibacter aggregans TaxID=1510150 RepID=A0A4R6UYP1_9GAMM|nr:HAMP domain-containing sensor histidine kinase [Permianibacter aggregans]QGX41410.1 HAMP domain-containing histidine kinase [Permianibacter aggregans]TDQ51199.1 histidine kinase/DNA gyrase B/HSP90-like ATPase [Permianibacter aggregans]